jgi:hypothetical protein
MHVNYLDLLTRLQNGVVTVVFEKVDGSERTMHCTLQHSFLPEEFRNKPTTMLTEQAPLTMNVWDVDASGWRSFRLSQVKSVS